MERMKAEMEEMKKEGGVSISPPPPPRLHTPPSNQSVSEVTTSLDGTNIHHGPNSMLYCFVGGVMTSV